MLARLGVLVVCCAVLLLSTVSNAAGDETLGRQPTIASSPQPTVSFAAAFDISDGSVSGVTSLVAGDVNGDQRADVFTIEGGKHAQGRRLFAWFQAPLKPEGAWQRHDFLSGVPPHPFLGAAALGDMDADGDLDLVVSADMHSGEKMEADVFLFLNPRPDAPATAHWRVSRLNKTTLPLHHINDMQLADLDQDGRLDVVCRSLEPNQVHLFFQNSLASFDHRTIDTQLEQSEGLAVGCLDDDALPDIAFTGVWLQAPAQPRHQLYRRRGIDAPYARVNQNTKEMIGDIDGDGRHDLVIGPAEAFREGKNHVLAWYKNPGPDYDNSWPQTVITADTNNHHTVRLGDLDGDGDLDLVTGIPWSRGAILKSVIVFFNRGDGQFGTGQTLIRDKGLYTGVLADVDADGDLDIIGQDSYSSQSRPWLYRNLGLAQAAVEED